MSNVIEFRPAERAERSEAARVTQGNRYGQTTDDHSVTTTKARMCEQATQVESMRGGAALLRSMGLGGVQLRKRPMFYQASETDMVRAPQSAQVVRSDMPTTPLGTVGHGHGVIQWADQLGLMDATTANPAGADYVRGYTLGGGGRFVAEALLETWDWGPDDQVTTRALSYNDNTGGGALRMDTNVVETFCANQISSQVAGLKGGFVIRHTSRADEQLQLMLHQMSFAAKNAEKMRELMERVATVRVTPRQVTEWVETLHPIEKNGTPLEGRSRTIAEGKREILYRLLEPGSKINGEACAIGQDLPGVQGTLRSLWKATTEYSTHWSNASAQGARDTEKKREDRLRQQLKGAAAPFAPQAIALIRQLAA